MNVTHFIQLSTSLGVWDGTDSFTDYFLLAYSELTGIDDEATKLV